MRAHTHTNTQHSASSSQMNFVINMERLLVLMWTIITAVHTQRVGFHSFGTTVACDETSYDLSVFYDGEKVLYYDHNTHRTVGTLPDFADPVVIPDLSKPARRAENVCKQALAIHSEAHINPPEELEAPWISMYTKSEVVRKVKNTLICHVADFFPPPVRVSWTVNNRNVTEGVAQSQNYQNSDGTLSMISTLSFTPVDGDVYSCTVEHRALPQPLSRIWDVEVQADQRSVFPKVVCVVGVCAGAFGTVVGIFLIIKANSHCS